MLPNMETVSVSCVWDSYKLSLPRFKHRTRILLTMVANRRDRGAYRAWTRDIIRYADVDPNGHVNNGAINAFLEDGRVRFRTEHLAAVAADTLAGFVLVSFSVEYHAPLHFPGEVDIGTSISRLGRTSYGLRQALFVGEQCAASSASVTVCVDPTTQQKRVLTDEWRALLSEFLVTFDES